MHVAASAGHVKVAAWLEEEQGYSRAAPIASFDSSRMLPIHLAASSGHVDIIRWLAKDVNATARGNITPLHMAALKGHSRVVQSLLAMSAMPFAAES